MPVAGRFYNKNICDRGKTRELAKASIEEKYGRGSCDADTNLAIPCPGEREITFGAERLLDTEGDKRIGIEPCNPAFLATATRDKNPDGAVQKWNEAGSDLEKSIIAESAITLQDPDLSRRLGAWAGRPGTVFYGSRAAVRTQTGLVASAKYNDPRRLDRHLKNKKLGDERSRDLAKDAYGPQEKDKEVHCAIETCVLEQLTEHEGDAENGVSRDNGLDLSMNNAKPMGGNVGLGVYLDVCIKARFRCTKPKDEQIDPVPPFDDRGGHVLWAPPPSNPPRVGDPLIVWGYEFDGGWVPVDISPTVATDRSFEDDAERAATSTVASRTSGPIVEQAWKRALAALPSATTCADSSCECADCGAHSDVLEVADQVDWYTGPAAQSGSQDEWWSVMNVYDGVRREGGGDTAIGGEMLRNLAAANSPWRQLV